MSCSIFFFFSEVSVNDVKENQLKSSLEAAKLETLEKSMHDSPSKSGKWPEKEENLEKQTYDIPNKTGNLTTLID